MKIKKRIVSLIIAIAVLSALGMPSFAAYESQGSVAVNNVIRDVENNISNTVAVLSNGEETYKLYPASVETVEIKNGSYATASQYTLELRDGGGTLYEDGKDVASTAIVTVTIYYDTTTMFPPWNIAYLKLTKFSVDISWTQSGVVLKGLSCDYYSCGLEPNGQKITSQQTKTHEFPISGRHYELNTGFTYFTAPEELDFVMGCTATTTFQRGASSVWDFTVACQYK